MAFTSPLAMSSSLRPIIRRQSRHIRSFSSTAAGREQNYYNPWSSKSHLKPPTTTPHPLPAIYPQKIILSDGSSFTSYTTAPTPSTVRLTRDVLNNPLYKPGADRRGMGEDGEGRVGKFRRRFEGLGSASEGELSGEQALEAKEEDAGMAVGRREISFEETDLEWMGEGAREEKAPKAPEAKKGQGKGKKK